jgi:nitrogen fixation/metabolism regulation signal transduction histidine kinase
VDLQEIERFFNEVTRDRTFLFAALDAMTDGVVIMKPNLEVQYLNSPAVDLLGLNPRVEILRKRLPVLVTIEEVRSLLARYALAPQRIDSHEIRTTHRPEPQVLSVTITPLDRPQTGLRGVILTVRDITAVTREQEERQRQRQIATMATLSAGLAHEIKNPLNSLLLHAQLLRQYISELSVSRRKKQGPDRERMLASASVIVDEIVRLNAKVNQFMAAVRPTSPKLEPVRLHELIHRVAEIVRPEVEAAGIELVTMADHELPVVQAESAQLIQVVQNLIKNSIEAIVQDRQCHHAVLSEDDQDGPATVVTHPRIEIRAELAGEGVALSVRDNGPGIPEAYLPRILEPYFTSKEMGTGLGLNIVSRIVEEHGGRLNVATRPVVDGTVMTVWLPTASRPVRKLGQYDKEELVTGDSEVPPAD